MKIKPYSLHFYNKRTGLLQQNIWKELDEGLWKDYNIQNHTVNSKTPANQPHKLLNVFQDFIVVNPGTYYDIESKELKEELYYPNYIKLKKHEVFEVFEKYFDKYNNRKIAVHLSGGLDSSIIICLLNHFKIPFYLVGLVSNRWEFRTEKAIQLKLAPLGLETKLIDMDEFPSFADLSKKELYQIPDKSIKQINASKIIAKTCKELGAEIVFTGQGGDTILADSITDRINTWSCNIGNEFIQTYDAEVVYPIEGLELVSPFANKDIINALYSFRIGKKNDHLKKWARCFFSDILPRELVDYTYCADFFGTSMDGLSIVKPEIEKIFKNAYEVTGNIQFSLKETQKFISIDVLNFEYQSYIEFCEKLSLATWYNALLREGYVK